ncbi:MAG TPA: ABC-type transport auxiliary lipoprotein family protein [Bryobacteraceae bacterium]|nr:ABC-type transport auxiliary lipoprotein family protein [Bryobacteraceae bacterium]
MKTVANTTVFALALLALAACGGKILYPKYYSMEIPAPPPHSVNARVLGTVAVRRFESAPYIRQKKIVYRPVPEEIGFYEYHRWVNDPAEMVTSAMIESLRSSGLFSSVTPYDAQNQQNYLMAGRLERLEETDYGGNVNVTAKLSAELVNLRTGSTEWTGNAAQTLKVDERSVNSVVIELGRAVQKSIDQIITSLGQQTQ